jgi:hypothetical protein
MYYTKCCTFATLAQLSARFMILKAIAHADVPREVHLEAGAWVAAAHTGAQWGALIAPTTHLTPQ